MHLSRQRVTDDSPLLPYMDATATIDGQSCMRWGFIPFDSAKRRVTPAHSPPPPRHLVPRAFALAAPADLAMRAAQPVESVTTATKGASASPSGASNVVDGFMASLLAAPRGTAPPQVGHCPP